VLSVSIYSLTLSALWMRESPRNSQPFIVEYNGVIVLLY
jgi:hypothetical protein